MPDVVPVAAASRVFDRKGRIQDQAIELQLKTLGGEVARVSERFAADESFTGTSVRRRLNALQQSHGRSPG